MKDLAGQNEKNGESNLSTEGEGGGPLRGSRLARSASLLVERRSGFGNRRWGRTELNQ